jgi:hypothetical protein
VDLGGHENGGAEEVPFGSFTLLDRKKGEVLDQPAPDREEWKLVRSEEDVPELTSRGISEREVVLEQFDLAREEWRETA